MKIFAINPGNTSTKIAMFEEDRCLFSKNVSHDASVLAEYRGISEQLPYRMETINTLLTENGITLEGVDAFVGRGGGLLAMEGGTYVIDELLLEHATKGAKLLDLEDDFDDDILREKIQTLSIRKRELERQLSDEQTRQSLQKRVDHVKDTLRTLKETWPSMTPLMRQSTCRDLIEKVIIDKEKGISIKLKLHSFLMKKEEVGTI